MRARKADARTYVLRLSQTPYRRRQLLPHYRALVECSPAPDGTHILLTTGREPQEVWFSSLALLGLIPIMGAVVFPPAVRALLALALVAGWWISQRLSVVRASRHLAKRLAAYLAQPAEDAL